MTESFRVAQKIGLLFRPEDAIPRDIKDWAMGQLSTESKSIGIKSISNSHQIEHWPEDYLPSLSERAEMLRQLRLYEDRIQKDKTLSKIEMDRLLWINEKKNNIRFLDELRFAHRNVYAEDQVKQRFSLFWSNHFTVGISGTTRGLIGHFMDAAILDNLNGSFSNMLYKVTTHPAMLTYLDNIYSVGENSERAIQCRKNNKCKVGLNDNLGRELLELHTVSPAANYTESDIRATAQVLAGWGTIVDKPQLEKFGLFNHWDAFVVNRAEPGTKIVLEKVIYAGKDGLRNLTEHLASHEHTQRHLVRKLCQHFVSDDIQSADVEYIIKVWGQSNGDLRKIHQAVIERAIASKAPKFQWPATWLFQVLRISDSTYFLGWDDIHKDLNDRRMSAKKVFQELGQPFWAKRQPNGYSSSKSYWISGEFLERRLRFSEAIYNTAYPQFTPKEMMDRIGVNSATRNLVEGLSGRKRKFIALMCSPELMGVQGG